MIVRKLEVGPFATNCFIVGSESTKEGMIIDPADEARAILENVKDLGLDIKLIVLTHGHLDHIGALKEVEEKTEPITRPNPWANMEVAEPSKEPEEDAGGEEKGGG